MDSMITKQRLHEQRYREGKTDSIQNLSDYLFKFLEVLGSYSLQNIPLYIKDILYKAVCSSWTSNASVFEKSFTLTKSTRPAAMSVLKVS